MQEGVKLNTKVVTFANVDYPEDADHENGQYLNVCIKCGVQFIGHKRRNICKKCSTEGDKSNDTSN